MTSPIAIWGMIRRDSHLQKLFDFSQQIIAACGDPRAVRAGERVFGRLSAHEGARRAAGTERLPVVECAIATAIAGLAAARSPVPDLAGAFAALEPDLAWGRRRNAEAVGEPFLGGHANAMLAGPGGLEERADVMVGVSLMAPHIVYPDHDHPPEEVYIALSPGEWWNAAMDWTEPGPGGIIYNPPGILHAMRSQGQPFLALWFLPLD